MRHKRIVKNSLSQATGFHFVSDEVLATSSLIPYDSNHIEKFDNSIIRDVILSKINLLEITKY